MLVVLVVGARLSKVLQAAGIEDSRIRTETLSEPPQLSTPVLIKTVLVPVG